MSCTTSCSKKPSNDKACFDRMAMGLSSTNYGASCALMYKYGMQNDIKSSYEQRQWLQNNAERLMAEERDASSCVPCNPNAGQPPEASIQQCNEIACTYASPNFGEGVQGVGTGRNYSYGNGKK